LIGLAGACAGIVYRQPTRSMILAAVICARQI
jgi:hypothetical protein